MRVTPGSASLTCITQGFVCHFKATVYAKGTSLPSLIHIQQDKHATAIGYRPTKLSFSTMTHNSENQWIHIGLGSVKYRLQLQTRPLCTVEHTTSLFRHNGELYKAVRLRGETLFIYFLETFFLSL